MKRLRSDNIFYTLFKDTDEVSFEETVSLGKRDMHTAQQNRYWLFNKLINWKKWGIAEGIYDTTHDPAPHKGYRRRLVGIKLTQRGKTLLGRAVQRARPADVKAINELSSLEITEVLAQWVRENPDLNFTFHIKLGEIVAVDVEKADAREPVAAPDYSSELINR
jgi:hypothetical protein